MSNQALRSYVRYRFIVAVLNVALFAILAVQQHGAWLSNPKRASRYETFACMLLERNLIPQVERESIWWMCCAECHPSAIERIFLLANIGSNLAIQALMPAIKNIGISDQVVFFYGSMPVLILLWWYLLGGVARFAIAHTDSRTKFDRAVEDR